jgi:P-type E1-E2 ATPase
MDESALFELAAIAELRSEHPLGKAIAAEYYQRRGVQPEQPEEFKLLAGRGVYAQYAGTEILAGNELLMAEQNVLLPDELIRIAEAARGNGYTIIYLAKNKNAVGIIALSDTLRPDAARTVEAIHNTGMKTILLTGDAKAATSHIAGIAGIRDVRPDCLPENKLDEIRRYQERGEPVCMVGDGINDAPALKTAHVGVAMGGVGSDIAIDAADIVLVGDEIKELPHLLQLAKKTMQTIKVNLAASMTLNFIAIALAITGILNPVVGALVHNVGSVAVIINSSLLLKWRKTN